MPVPDWVWPLLSLPILGVLLTLAYSHFASKRSEQKEVRREGAAVVTPIQEVIAAFSPAALIWGNQEQLNEHMREWHGKWAEHRRALMTYANAYRNRPIHKLAEQLVQAVNLEITAGQYLVYTHFSNTAGMDAYEDANKRTMEAEAGAKALLDEIA